MPALLAAPAARVVSVSSVARLQGRPVNPVNPHLHGKYNPWGAYGQSKLANYHFALGLQREFERAGVSAQSLVAHPGLSHSELQVRTVEEGGGGWQGPFWAWMARYLGMKVADGALPQIRAATDPDAEGRRVLRPTFRQLRSRCAAPRAAARQRAMPIETLWQVSETETGVELKM